MMPEDNLGESLKERYEKKLYFYRYPLLFSLIGLTLIISAVGLYKNQIIGSSEKIEVLNSTTESQKNTYLFAEISGAVQNPGVYKLSSDARVEDLLIASGGLSENADRQWLEKKLNRAAKLPDGQKIYIPKFGETDNYQSDNKTANNGGVYQTASSVFGAKTTGLININTASLSELDSLPGIGPVYGQNIIDNRMYSSIDDLVNKNILKKSVYEKIKDLITI